MRPTSPAEKLLISELHAPPGPPRPLPLEPLFFIRMVAGLAWSGDSSALFFETNITGRYNLWRVPSTGGWPIQLTVSEERTQLVSTSNDGRFLLYTQDEEGDEKPNLFLMSPRGGAGVPLTATTRVGYRGLHFSHDSTQLAFAAEIEGPGRYGVFIVALPESLEALAEHRPAPRRIIPADERMWRVGAWSRDDRFLAVIHTVDSHHNGVAVVDLQGNVKELIPDDREHETEVIAWSPDGSKLLVNSNLGPGGQMAPGLLSIATGEITWLVISDWEATALQWSLDGRHIAWKLNEAGSERLYLLEVASGTSTEVPLETGVFGAVRFNPDGSRLAFSYGSADRPSDLWAMPLGGTPFQVSHSLVGGLEASDFVRPRIVTFPSADGTLIPAFLYLPRGAVPDGDLPGLVMIRGGPTAQTQNRWSRDIQYLVSRGYAVIAPNYRGSTGFGREFMESNRMDLGGGDLQDIIAARGFLIDSGYVDAARVGLMGGSYGGYLTLMALTKAPELWTAGVAVVPFANWFTEYEKEDEVLQTLFLFHGGDERVEKLTAHNRFDLRSGEGRGDPHVGRVKRGGVGLLTSVERDQGSRRRTGRLQPGNQGVKRVPCANHQPAIDHRNSFAFAGVHPVRLATRR